MVKVLFSLLKLLGATLAVLLVVVLLLWHFGPRNPVPTSANAHALDVPADISSLDAWLQQKESVYADLTPGVAKEIVWADATAPQKTEWSVVYLHGFSATSAETRPLPDKLAEALGANLYFTRFRGHGRGSDAMLDGNLQAWMDDAAEALEVGRRIGDKQLVIGVSTGATLAAMAAANTEENADIAAWLLISPNFAVKAAGSSLLTGPWAKHWLPLLVGETRSWEPLSEQHGRYWTTTYSNLALLPMAASVEAAAALDYSQIKAPALFVFSDEDQVVDASVSRDIAERWGAGADILAVDVGPDDDPYHHVIAGDILSPNMTAPMVDAVLQWLQKTQN